MIYYNKYPAIERHMCDRVEAEIGKDRTETKKEERYQVDPTLFHALLFSGRIDSIRLHKNHFNK